MGKLPPKDINYETWEDTGYGLLVPASSRITLFKDDGNGFKRVKLLTDGTDFHFNPKKGVVKFTVPATIRSGDMVTISYDFKA